jgi:hypothetical protein
VPAYFQLYNAGMQAKKQYASLFWSADSIVKVIVRELSSIRTRIRMGNSNHE